MLVVAAAVHAAAALGQIALKSPAWSELTPQERIILAPLAPDWD